MERGPTDTAKIATLSRSSLMVLVVSNRIPVAKGFGRRILNVDGSKENGRSHNHLESLEQRSCDQ
jgi:hypothetical protein